MCPDWIEPLTSSLEQGYNCKYTVIVAVKRGAWKNRKLKTETDMETDGGNGNTQACTDTYVFNLTQMEML